MSTSVDIDRLDAALHTVRARFREREVVHAVRRVCGLSKSPISTEQIRAQSSLIGRKSMWLGIREAVAHGFVVGEYRPGKGWTLAIAPRFARQRAASQ